ncbi:zf-HC2 domain-containing protein [Streptomyces nitrosporeus]|uniref:zf-HC2 domain-containing protein n=1 Tax=Streptomyces nitrosporeus TaxID=28894 RepID=UPI0039A2A085
MTSATDAVEHPDVSEISDLTEGLLPPDRAADIRHHLASCAECHDTQVSLEEIRSLLAGGGDEAHRESMPEDIAARIDAALAAEPFPVPASGAAAGVVSRETHDRTGEPGAAARPSGRPRGATGPGRRSARRRRTVVLGSVFGAAVVGVSAFLLQSVQLPGASLSSADQAAGSAAKGAQDFSGPSLEEQVRHLLKAAPAPVDSEAEASEAGEGEPSADAKSPQDLTPGTLASGTPLRAPAVEVPLCVQRGTGRNTPALAVEQGSFEGTAAFLVVLPDASDPERVQAYVVDAGCVGSTPVTYGRLLRSDSYARP